MLVDRYSKSENEVSVKNRVQAWMMKVLGANDFEKYALDLFLSEYGGIFGIRVNSDKRRHFWTGLSLIPVSRCSDFPALNFCFSSGLATIGGEWVVSCFLCLNFRPDYIYIYRECTYHAKITC